MRFFQRIGFFMLPLMMALPFSEVFAHGEDRAGPHGGYLRMPGGFHTEVVKKSAQNFEIYLLDIEWKNPLVEKSTVTAHLQRGKNVIALTCAAAKKKFICKLLKSETTKDGDILVVAANRNGMPGTPASYSLPLSLGDGPHSAH